jgi:thiosulfate/3-mercaptopyruvate sulfurtransferase
MKLRIAVMAGVLTMLLLVAPQPAGAQCGGHGTRESMVVSTAWLSDHLKDANLVVLAIGQRSDYETAHIPGSLFLNYPDIHAPSPEGLRTELPKMERLAEVFESLGVSNGSRVVIYALNDWASPAARVFLTLDAMGLGARASLLNGSMRLWKSEGRAVTTEVRTPVRGKIQPCPQKDVIAKLDEVRAGMKRAGVTIVDSRNPEFYTGEQIPTGQRAGHIPGSVNITFSTLLDQQGKLLADDALRARFLQAGVKSGDRVLTYCHIGQQASLVYLTARYLGFDARMYDGSWDEWSRRTELPAETAAPQR